MKPKCIVFDIGGVILDWHNCRRFTLKSLNISLEEFNPVFLKYLPLMELGKITPETAFEQILLDLKSSKDPQETYHGWQSNIKPILCTRNLIDSLVSKYDLAICTNTWINAYDKYNYKMFPEIFSKFKFCIDSSKLGMVKPNQDIYRKVEEETGFSGKDIFFIDDSRANILGAKALNWNTYLFDLGQDDGCKSCQKLRQVLL